MGATDKNRDRRDCSGHRSSRHSSANATATVNVEQDQSHDMRVHRVSETRCYISI